VTKRLFQQEQDSEKKKKCNSGTIKIDPTDENYGENIENYQDRRLIN
jgi:hypothetical protein